MTKKIIRIQELAEMMGVSTVTIWRWRRAGKLPKPIALGERVVGWREEVIAAWIEEQQATTELPY